MNIPPFLQHLPVYGEYPVPFTVFYRNGKPDFRITDRDKQIQCVTENLCAICGKKMTRFWFIGGPKSIDSGMFTDGPMHRECAEFSAKTCPFLSGKRVETSHRPAEGTETEVIVINEEVDQHRPEKMGLREAGSFEFGLYKSSTIYRVTNWRGKTIWF